MTNTTAKNPPFEPFPLLSNGHLMTIVPTFIPRRFPTLASSERRRIFEVSPGVKLLAQCHWQHERLKHPTLILVHGLEGSADSHSVLGVTIKALARGFNVVRMNMRNCGGTFHMTPTLYDSGMSQDVLWIVNELRKEGLKEICLAGWSMGGNIILKAAAELGEDGPGTLSAICAISPAIDLPTCITFLEKGFNRVYEHHFLTGLKTLLRKKASIFPGIFDLANLDKINSLKQFDEKYTAYYGGWGSAQTYYEKASALPVLHQIRVPTLIIQAKDDPLIPFCSFESPALQSEFITLIATDHGGHGGFLQKEPENEPDLDHFWAENRAITYLKSKTSQAGAKSYLEFI